MLQKRVQTRVFKRSMLSNVWQNLKKKKKKNVTFLLVLGVTDTPINF